MKTAYLIGIKGVGMTALAKYLSEAGFSVEGSDNADTYVTDNVLLENKIKVYSPFSEENLKQKNPDLVVVSAAYDKNNIEVKTAYDQKLNIKYYSDVLADITAEKKLIAVAGIHGKTTTSSLLALLLENAKLDPSYIIGAANVPVLNQNAHAGTGDYFVLEADEYRRSPQDNQSKFLSLNPQIAIISSIELDHPDIFNSIEEIYQAFYSFACRVDRAGKIILNIDYPKAQKLAHSLADRSFETYGFDSTASWQIVNTKEGDQTLFSIKHDGNLFGPYELAIPGKHNISNAATAVILANLLDIDDQILKTTLKEFRGVERRFQITAQVGDITIIDDYAHHPTAIMKTLEAAKAKYPKAKIVCIFQPHTYSRTQALLKEFGTAFSLADKVIVTDIYTSAREAEGKITSQDLVNEIKKNHNNVQYMNSWDKIKKYLVIFGAQPTVILTVGAGDIYKLGRELPEVFKK